MTVPIPSLEFARHELIAMRLCLAYAIYWLAIPQTVGFVSQPHPVGLARCLDLTFLARPRLYAKLKFLAMVSLLLYASGLERAVSTTYLFLFCTAIGSLRNSQGTIVHSKQVLSMVLLVQAGLYLWAFFHAMFSGRSVSIETAEADGLAAFWSQQAILATYFTAGISKMIRSRGTWIWQVAKIPLQILKSSEQYHHDELKPVDLRRRTAVAEWLLRHPTATRAFFGLGLAVELVSPLFLLSKTALFCGGGLLLIFHQASAFCLRLSFLESRILLLIYLVNLPGLFVSAIRDL